MCLRQDDIAQNANSCNCPRSVSQRLSAVSATVSVSDKWPAARHISCVSVRRRRERQGDGRNPTPAPSIGSPLRRASAPQLRATTSRPGECSTSSSLMNERAFPPPRSTHTHTQREKNCSICPIPFESAKLSLSDTSKMYIRLTVKMPSAHIAQKSV